MIYLCHGRAKSVSFAFDKAAGLAEAGGGLFSYRDPRDAVVSR